MDPNQTLKEIRRLLVDLLVDQETGPVAQELAGHVEALDDWLTEGGFLPDSWKPADEQHALEIAGLE